MVQKRDFGTVIILKGEYAGFVGYYDDDIDDEEAVVYVGTSLFQTGTTILRRYLEPTPEKVVLLALHRLLKKHPEVKDYFGIVLRG